MTSVLGWAAALAVTLVSAGAPAMTQTSGADAPPSAADGAAPTDETGGTGPHRPGRAGIERQEPPPGMSVGQRPSVAPAENWTDEEVEAVARALRNIATVMEDGRRALAGAEDAATRRDVEDRIFRRMLLAVEAAGLTIERYNALIAAINNDPDLREQVAGLLAPDAAAEPEVVAPDDGVPATDGPGP